jgi:hypothetical protein
LKDIVHGELKTSHDKLVEYSKQTTTVLDDLNNDKYIDVVSKRTTKNLTKRLQQLKTDLNEAAQRLNAVHRRYKCSYDKICYAEEIETAETNFYQMWHEEEKLKKKCLSKFYNNRVK